MPFPAAEDSSLWTACSISSSCARATPRDDSRAGWAQWLLINIQALLENKTIQRDLGQQDLLRGSFLTLIPKLTSHEAAGALTSCHLFPPVRYPCVSPPAEHEKCRALPLPFHTSYPAQESGNPRAKKKPPSADS